MTLSTRLIAILLMAEGCNWGTPPQKYPPALSPAGADVTVDLANKGGQLRGELFAVDSTGIYLRGASLQRVAWSRIKSMDVLKLDDPYDVRPGEQVNAEKLRLLRPLTRFPQGLPPELMKKVLQRLGQPAVDSTLAALADSASRATVRFRDQRVAIEEGYHRLGPDFPGMGEHWLSVGALLRGTLDPARPALLAYADVAGHPTLLGIGFVTVLRGSGQPRDVPGWPDAWHEHSGLFAEESSGAAHGDSADPDGDHLWVLHVWSELPNPDGRYQPDNWMLPFTRLGVHTDTVTYEAARAISLLSGGDAFLLASLADAGVDASPGSPCATSVASGREAAAKIMASAGAGRHLAAAQVDALGAAWRDLASALRREHGPRVDPLLAPAHRVRPGDRAHEHRLRPATPPSHPAPHTGAAASAPTADRPSR